jgi:hypothetical protein
MRCTSVTGDFIRHPSPTPTAQASRGTDAPISNPAKTQRESLGEARFGAFRFQIAHARCKERVFLMLSASACCQEPTARA